MRAPRFIFHNNIIEQYKLEEYNDHKRRMDEIESMKSTIYKSIENNKSLSQNRYQMLQHTSKYNQQQKQQTIDRLQLILDKKIDQIKHREYPFKSPEISRSRVNSQIELRQPKIQTSMENMNLLRKLSSIKPNINIKEIDENYEKSKQWARRLRKFHKLPYII
ncbi:hypothetical protein pb186bvf_011299 [Paramecium bursaria]